MSIAELDEQINLLEERKDKLLAQRR